MLLGPGLKLLHFGEPYQSEGEVQNQHHIQAMYTFCQRHNEWEHIFPRQWCAACWTGKQYQCIKHHEDLVVLGLLACAVCRYYTLKKRKQRTEDKNQRQESWCTCRM